MANSIQFTLQACRFIASGFLSGRVPFAPGTAGTIAFWVLSLVIHALVPATFEQWRLFIAILVTVLGYVSVLVVLKRETVKDPQWIVVDEWAGLATAYCFLPGAEFALLPSVTALILFRVFDISKLWPISRLEDLPGALGIMADDVAAGILAGICIQILCLTSLFCL